MYPEISKDIESKYEHADNTNLCHCVNCDNRENCSLGICINQVVLELSKNPIVSGRDGPLLNARITISSDKNNNSHASQLEIIENSVPNKPLFGGLTADEFYEIAKDVINFNITDEMLSNSPNINIPEPINATTLSENEDISAIYNKNVEWLRTNGIDITDFLYNYALAWLDIQYDKIINNFSLNDILNDISYTYADISSKKLNYRAKKAYNTKKYNYKYISEKWTKNKLYVHEIELLLHEVIRPENKQLNKRQNPLLKLTNSENIDKNNFLTSDLQNIITYYKCLYKYIDSLDDMSTIEKILIIYHLEIEIRFETFIKLLEKLHSTSACTASKRIYEDTKISEAGMFSGFKVQNKSYQSYIQKNKIFYGVDSYIDKFIQSENDDYITISKNMYKITKLLEILTENNTCHYNKLSQDNCPFIKDLYDKTMSNIKTLNINYDIGETIKLKSFISIYSKKNK